MTAMSSKRKRSQGRSGPPLARSSRAPGTPLQTTAHKTSLKKPLSTPSRTLRAYLSMKRSKAGARAVAPDASEFRLRVGSSRIQGLGLFARQSIPARSKVIEYTGARFPRREMRKLVKEIIRRGGSPSQYLLRMNRYWCLDGEIGGSGAEYVNHSCEANVVARKRGDRVFLFSRRRIRSGEELTLDYRLRRTNPLIPCHCRSLRCRGTINLKKG